MENYLVNKLVKAANDYVYELEFWEENLADIDIDDMEETTDRARRAINDLLQEGLKRDIEGILGDCGINYEEIKE